MARTNVVLDDKLAALTTLLGVAIMLTGVILTIFFYNHFNAEQYSFLNHFVSELGWTKRSRMAWIFNRSLTIGSLMLLPSLYALGQQLHIRPRLGHTTMSIGLCTILAGSAVGIFPMGNMTPHLWASFLFFWGWFLTVLLFTWAFYRDRTDKTSRRMVVAGIGAALLCVVFMVFPKDSLVAAIRNINTFKRPDIWWIAIMEWAVFFSMCLWVSMAMIVLWCRSARRAQYQGKSVS